ncbi:MAG: c-type cytochrome [Alphaproteobacteria bacterium]|nr:c-type cytochrome [Alphaproteobacteria bacterium]
MKKLLQISLSMAIGFVGTGLVHAQDAKEGEKKIAMCVGCHGIPGYRATFPEIYRVPMIAGQNAKYLATALGEYAKGDRKHPTMRGIAGSLSDKDVADISAYYQQQAQLPAAPDTPAPPSAKVAELLSKGACTSCHGANLSKPIDGSYPKLAGQNADYLYAALKAYQTSANSVVGRGNAIMAGQVKSFSHEELHELANYIGSLQGEIATVPESRFR